MGKHKLPVSIDYAKCAPCSGLICMGVCPQGVLESGSNKKPEVADAASCTQCAVCVDLCPSKAITLTRNKQSNDL